MKSIYDVDKNFRLKAEIQKEGMSFFNIEQEPFSIHGIFKENGKFRRIPEDVARSVSENVYYLHTNTAGGRVRFKTNSSRISIIAKMEQLGLMPHFALTGSVGFDLYAKEETNEVYCGSFIPPFNVSGGFESTVYLPNGNMKTITINFPLYSGVTELYIGIENNSLLERAEEYAITKPVVFYGSSITQGGCASRPGTSYESILSRKLDFDYINLGFSGSARAEQEIVVYIKGLEMSVFVMDYDHNAPNVEHLQNTHEKMFKAIREQNPDLPIILMSRPKYYLNDEEKKRLEIIRTTYQNALAKGDCNVYLIDGKKLMELAKDEGTVDNCHPTDLGFFSMACAVEKVLSNILKK